MICHWLKLTAGMRLNMESINHQFLLIYQSGLRKGISFTLLPPLLELKPPSSFNGTNATCFPSGYFPLALPLMVPKPCVCLKHGLSRSAVLREVFVNSSLVKAPLDCFPASSPSSAVSLRTRNTWSWYSLLIKRWPRMTFLGR